MTNKTTAPGAGSARVVPTGKDHNPVKTSASGGRVPVSLDKREAYYAKVKARWGEHPSKPWPFDPTEPKPRPQTWRNRIKAVKRYFASEIFWEHHFPMLTFLIVALAVGVRYQGL